MTPSQDPTCMRNGTDHGTSATAVIAEMSSAGEGALPPGWRAVPSVSRPGQRSYVHMPTGLKQSKRPLEEPSEEAVAAFHDLVAKAKQKV